MNTKDNVKKAALEDYRRGSHCAEVVLKYLGKEWAEGFDPGLARLATPFGGGIAEKGDLCGALAGGLMLVGYLTGRRDYRDSQATCWDLSKRYYDLFRERFGSTDCAAIHSLVYNPTTHEKCAVTVEAAIDILWELLDDARREGRL